MSKAILVIGKPEYCGECPLCIYEGIFVCNRTMKKVDKNKMYEDCPLRPLPKFKHPNGSDVFNDYVRGYNDCLREILGEINDRDI